MLRSVLAQERDAPGSLVMAKTLKGLGNLYKDREDYSAAKECFEKELKILTEKDPKSCDITTASMDLTSVILSVRDRSGCTESSEW